MPTRKALERLAEQAERDRRRWQAKADLWQARADACETQRDELRQMAASTGTLLHTRSQSASVIDVNAAAKLNMSRASSEDPFVKAIRAKGITQNDLARKLKIPPSLLSMYRRGVRRIPAERALEIQRLTGWTADAKHWPGGIVAAD